MNLSDVLIHINDPLNDAQRLALEEEMRQIDGVIAPRFNPGQEHILLVAFDPDLVHASALLEKARAHGYQAQLVGA